ncbi:MAG: hypothetical protein ABFD91_03835 [Anaerohalosphaeraceae bacterium]
MFKHVYRSLICFMLTFAGSSFGASIILNEYNAVDDTEYLGGGMALVDESGGRATDSYFGRILGNGGDWFELVVITDHLDMRYWKFDIYTDGVLDETLDLTGHSIWSDLRSGTIITISENVPSDISYNPAAGDWWINVQANNGSDGMYIEASSFPVNSSNWQLRIRNMYGVIVFGPAGEGVSPASGIGSNEVFKLEATPSAATVANSTDYDGAKILSTFGLPNQWGLQSLNALRNVTPGASSLTLLFPNGTEVIKAGSVIDITWSNTGTIDTVVIEFSVDNGLSWAEVYPANAGNNGSYAWLVPMIDTQQCRVRVSNVANPGVYDISNAPFTVFQCELEGDVTGDCIVDLNDLALMAISWLECGNPVCP